MMIENDRKTLQHILMLKYLGFSLQQISNIIENKVDIPEHLSQQKKLLKEKKEHLEKLISTIEVVQNSDGEKQWNALLHLLNLMSEDEKVIEQYQSSVNLDKRINLYAYSTSKQNWFDWVYERLQIQSGQKILEIGEGHMNELHEMVGEFDADIIIEIPSEHHTTYFRLENGMDFLKEHFNMIKLDIQDNNLLVDDVEAIYNYVHSYPGNAPYILEKRADEFREMIKKKLEKEGVIYIHKSAGMFICQNTKEELK